MSELTLLTTQNSQPQIVVDDPPPLPFANNVAGEVSMKPIASAELPMMRLPKHLQRHYEIKDPSVVMIAPDKFMMFASIGNSQRQEWLVGRFEASSLQGPWIELEPVKFVNLSGPQLCAPAVTYDPAKAEAPWEMYIQTACFEADGIIALATSKDGETFHGVPTVLASRETVANPPAPVIGVYDVGVSEVKQGDEELLCMLYSGYRRVGCGDLFLSTRRKNDPTAQWSTGECLLAQEAVPFHNSPDYEHFEWGLEGAKLIQLADDSFLLIGVCFLPLPHEYLGTRQRVFLAAAKSINGPFVPMGTPFLPVAVESGEAAQEKAIRRGENGHPDTLIIDNQLWVIYQERSGNGQPWYLRYAVYEMDHVKTEVERFLA
jgi:hypothetical protein